MGEEEGRSAAGGMLLEGCCWRDYCMGKKDGEEDGGMLPADDCMRENREGESGVTGKGS